MYKFVIMQGDVKRGEAVLEAKEISIGRDPKSDIVLHDASVSRQHARLVRVLKNYYLEDLESTNGTQHNNRPITKHLLKHEDEIRIGTFRLQFLIAEEAAARSTSVAAQAVTGGLAEAASPAPQKAPTVQLPKTARLRFFRGPNAGRTDVIGRGLYTIGKPGGAVAAITRRPQGFFLLHIGGENSTKINNQVINSVAGVKLNEAGVVEVGESLAEITFPRQPES